MVEENLMSNEPGRFKSLKLFSLIPAMAISEHNYGLEAPQGNSAEIISTFI